jgi:ribosomal protein S18 acetylase RimI-like enzyme
MQFTIRAARAEDYGALCELFESVDALHRSRFPSWFQRPEGPARDEEYILRQIEEPDARLYIAEAEGQIVGFVSAFVRDTPSVPILVPRRFAFVDNLFVREDLRRAGIGRALMTQVEQWALAQEASEMELTVYEFNIDAIEFYRGLGYATTSRRMYKPLRETDHE